MAWTPDDDVDDAARSVESGLVAGLVSAIRSRGGAHLDQAEIDAALGVTHDEADQGSVED